MMRLTAVVTLGLSCALGASSPACEIAEPALAQMKVTPHAYGDEFEHLSDWHLFTNLSGLVPAEGVIPYDVNAPLFTDYTKKFRWIYVPKGAKANYSADEVWDLPIGTILVKAFTYAADARDPESKLQLLETRILFRQPDGWDAQTYVWDADQKDATRQLAGPEIDASFIDSSGESRINHYLVPSAEQCKSCHMTGNADTTGMHAKGVVSPIGIRTRELNRDHLYGPTDADNQIDHFAKVGVFAAPLPPASSRQALVDPFGAADLTTRVRSYWDSNCAHCHKTGGLANPYGLHFDFASTDPARNPPSNWGVCKVPAAAPGGCGDLDQRIDIVPGNPDASFMVCRMAAALDGPDAKMHMPPLGVRMVHTEAVALVSDWIASLPADSCVGGGSQ
jgi:uncharacterized repeat protein (TIGR03806 family)